MDEKKPHDNANETVAVTLQLEPKVYDFFNQKAQTAGVDVETYLCQTLSIVLGCRAFSTISVCSSVTNDQTPP